MTTFFTRIATVLAPFLIVIRIATLFGVALIIYLLVKGDATSQAGYLQPTLLAVLWGLLLNLLIVNFKPQLQAPLKKGLLASIKAKFFSLLTSLLTLMFVVLTIATLYLTLRLTNI